MVVVQLMASPFFGGPERQMLGLALSLPAVYKTVFLSFPERGLSRPLLERAREAGFEAIALEQNTPHFRRAAREVAGHLRRLGADILCCSGYKPDVIGWLAARQAGVPAVSVSHGWTAATLKVRLYEALDRLILRWMDCTVCVSEGQAAKVRRAGVPPEKMVLIRNAIRAESYAHADPAYGCMLRGLFPEPPRRVVGAAGRLSPEKGFENLVEAAAVVRRADPGVGFVLFGDGPLREELTRQVAARGLGGHFVFAGFRADLERYLPHLDVLALPSYTEGLPVIMLEACAAGLPVVASAVGGVPEVVEDGVTGYLVPPKDPARLAGRLLDVLRGEADRRAMGQRGRRRIQEHFTFEAQSLQYQRLFERLTRRRRRGHDYGNGERGGGSPLRILSTFSQGADAPRAPLTC
jgi:glycosyltransferase involved in cell wall biosynthesis